MERNIRIKLLANRELGERCRKLIEKHAEIVEEDYDIGFSILWHKRIPEEELDKGRWINLHIGKLPEYKGIYIPAHVIYNKEKKMGVTLHEMDKSFDTGPIIAVKEFKFSTRDVERLYTISFNEAYHHFKRWLPKLLEGDYTTVPNQGGTYYNAKDYIKIRDKL